MGTLRIKREESISSPEETQMIEQVIYARQAQGSPTPAMAVTQNGFIRAGAGLISNSMMEID